MAATAEPVQGFSTDGDRVSEPTLRCATDVARGEVIESSSEDLGSALVAEADVAPVPWDPPGLGVGPRQMGQAASQPSGVLA